MYNESADVPRRSGREAPLATVRDALQLRVAILRREAKCHCGKTAAHIFGSSGDLRTYCDDHYGDARVDRDIQRQLRRRAAMRSTRR